LLLWTWYLLIRLSSLL